MTEARRSRNMDVLRRLHLPLFSSRDASEVTETTAAAAGGAAAPNRDGGGDGAVEELASPQAVAARDNVTAMVESAMESAAAPSRPDGVALVESGGVGGGAGAAPSTGVAGETAMTMEDTASGQSRAGRERGREEVAFFFLKGLT